MGALRVHAPGLAADREERDDRADVQEAQREQEEDPLEDLPQVEVLEPRDEEESEDREDEGEAFVLGREERGGTRRLLGYGVFVLLADSPIPPAPPAVGIPSLTASG